MNGKFPWFLRGVVVHGHGRGGTQLGFPTANVELNASTTAALKPFNNLVLYGWGCIEPLPDGTDASEDLGPHPFAMSVGFNPQFHDQELSAEVHFIHKFSHDFYGRTIRIIAAGSLREQAAFTTLEALIQTIQHDVEETHNKLSDPANIKLKEDSFVQPKIPFTECTTVPFFRN